MTLADIRRLIEDAEGRGTDLGCSPRLMRQLVAIVDAAKNEAIRYNEAYCNRAECEQMTDGWATLDDALAALEAAP